MGLLSTLFGGDDDDRNEPYLDDDEDGDYYAEDDDWGIGEVVIFCDRRCGTEFRADIVGETSVARFAAARAYLADQGWTIEPGEDICPGCSAG